MFNVHIVPSLSTSEKKGIIDWILELVPDPDEITCILGGDFNFISEDDDMMNLRTGHKYGTMDAVAKHWQYKATLLTEHFRKA